MGAIYPYQVGGHKPCVPELFARFVPISDHLLFCHDGGRWMSQVDIGATQDLSQRGVGRSGRESVRAVGRFGRNAFSPPEWECEAMGSVVWVQCTNLYRVYIKSIDSRARG